MVGKRDARRSRGLPGRRSPPRVWYVSYEYVRMREVYNQTDGRGKIRAEGPPGRIRKEERKNEEEGKGEERRVAGQRSESEKGKERRGIGTGADAEGAGELSTTRARFLANRLSRQILCSRDRSCYDTSDGASSKMKECGCVMRAHIRRGSEVVSGLARNREGGKGNGRGSEKKGKGRGKKKKQR